MGDEEVPDTQGVAAELLEQVRANALGVEKFLEAHAGQFLDLFFRIVDAAFVTDTGADLPHDLLDVHRVRTDVELGHDTPSGIRVGANAVLARRVTRAAGSRVGSHPAIRWDVRFRVACR